MIQSAKCGLYGANGSTKTCILLGLFVFAIVSLAGQSQGDGRFRKLIVLRQQADVVRLARDLAADEVPVSEQHRQIVDQLQTVASESQPPVISVLEDLKAKGEVFDYKPFFVANCIAVEATGSALSQIEQLPQVLRVEEDYPIVLDPEPTEPAPGNPLDNVEIGLRNIRAPEVWALGVTGASILVAHFDSGVNGNHPALAGRWRGSYGYPPSACWYDLNGSTRLSIRVIRVIRG